MKKYKGVLIVLIVVNVLPIAFLICSQFECKSLFNGYIQGWAINLTLIFFCLIFLALLRFVDWLCP